MFPDMEFPGKRGRQAVETVQAAVKQAGALVLTALITALAALAVSVVALAMVTRRPAHA
jgi:hypothetical protein